MPPIRLERIRSCDHELLKLACLPFHHGGIKKLNLKRGRRSKPHCQRDFNLSRDIINLITSPYVFSLTSLIFLCDDSVVVPGRVERPTCGFVDRCSIQLSYGHKRLTMSDLLSFQIDMFSGL